MLKMLVPRARGIVMHARARARCRSRRATLARGPRRGVRTCVDLRIRGQATDDGGKLSANDGVRWRGEGPLYC